MKPHDSNLKSSNGAPRDHGTVLLPVAAGEPEPGVTPTPSTGACTGSPRFSPILPDPLPYVQHQLGVQDMAGQEWEKKSMELGKKEPKPVLWSFLH